MRNTKNNLKKTALLADGVQFTIKGFYNHHTNELKSFVITCSGDIVRDIDALFVQSMIIDRTRSNGRFLTLYSFDLMRNRTVSKIKYTDITILN
jgi:hypothetical protein